MTDELQVRGITTGMRGKDLRSFMQVARQFNVILLIRHTNEDSLKYVGKPGFYPKPAAVKAKTADMNPPGVTRLENGKPVTKLYKVAGLVVHPGFQPACYKEAKIPKAQDCWEHTLETLSPTLQGKKVELNRPESWSLWGVERQGVLAPRWKWRVDVDPNSDYFGCLQLKSGAMEWSYVHGDYDLKDVIVVGREQDNRRAEGKLDGVKNFTPVLHGVDFTAIQTALNQLIGADMVQHGAEAQFAWHGDEPITVAYPDWRHLTLLSAETVQSWYMQLNREVMAKQGTDYLRDRSRQFHFGPQGMFKPGALPSATWGK
jgi:hypothetical protein